MYSLKVSLAVTTPLVELRAIYDKYGDYGLKEGITDKSGKRIGGGYFLKENPETVYDRVFTTTDPWEDVPNMDGSDLQGSMFSDAFRG